MPSTRIAAVACAFALVAASCSTEGMAGSSTASSTSSVLAGAKFPTERCEKNRAAGKITYLSGFDFAASASIIDVLLAEQKGYFEDLCLDVEVLPSDATMNYPLVADNTAQFASGGSFNEVVGYRADNAEADVVVLAVEGKAAIDVLIVKPGEAGALAELRGKTIGVKEKITPSVKAMLAKADLIEGTDYQTVSIAGYDPIAHIELADIAAFPGYKSNEPGQLDRAGHSFSLFDPSDDGIPGSFGVIYTNSEFVAKHRTAAEDFMRAAMQGLADAIADPAAASMIALDFIENSGNPNHLSPDGETFRWQIESELIADSTPASEPVGLPDGDELGSEVAAYADIGLYDGKTPDISGAYDASVLAAIYDSGHKVIWPST